MQTAPSPSQSITSSAQTGRSRDKGETNTVPPPETNKHRYGNALRLGVTFGARLGSAIRRRELDLPEDDVSDDNIDEIAEVIVAAIV